MNIWKNLNETEVNHMVSYYSACRGLQERVLKIDALEIMIKLLPEEFSQIDKPFFERYKNKKVWIYNYTPTIGKFSEDEWLILEDDDYELNISCFEEKLNE